MERPIHILVECPDLIASVKVGVLEPLAPLVQQGKCEVVFLKTPQIKRKDIAWCDVFICVRGCETATLRLVEAAKDAQRFLIYFLDDDLLHVPSDIPSSEYFADKMVQESFVQIIKNCDLLWAVNQKIIDKYGTYFPECALSRVPAKIERDFLLPKDGKVHFLYAGSADHTDLVRKYLQEPIKRICEEYKNKVAFTFIGPDPDLRDLPQVKHHAFFKDYDQYRKAILEENFQAGLAVIKTEDFYQCKYYNKFIEYTAIGAVGIYTNSFPYTQVVKDGENGILCRNDTGEWYSAIKKLVEDPHTGQEYWQKASEMLEKDFTYEKICKELCGAIPQLTSYQAPPKNAIDISLENTFFIFYVKRAAYFWRKHGLFSLPLIFVKGVKTLTLTGWHIFCNRFKKAIHSRRKSI